MVIPLSEFAAGRDAADPQNPVREVWPPSFEGLSAIALDRGRRSRTR